MDFCICLSFGCPTKYSPEGDGQAHMCPRCHNASMFATKGRQWLEICFVPLVPMSSSHVWRCSICNCELDQSGAAPPLAGAFPPQGPYMQPSQGYGPPPVQSFYPQQGQPYPQQAYPQGQYGK